MSMLFVVVVVLLQTINLLQDLQVIAHAHCTLLLNRVRAKADGCASLSLACVRSDVPVRFIWFERGRAAGLTAAGCEKCESVGVPVCE